VEFRILGHVQAVHAGVVLPLGGPRHRRLLAVLLLQGGGIISVRQLISALWGETPPSSARQMLYVRISELRAALRAGRPELDYRAGGYRLRVGPDALDAQRFERLAAAGARALAGGDPARARNDLAAALALWRGEALAEFADEPFARSEAARLTEVRWQATENRITAELHLGWGGELVAELRKLVAEHPLRERFWVQLMLALYRAGRQGEALEAFQTAQRIAVEQLGIDPGAELRRLHVAILRQDPGLDPWSAQSLSGRADHADLR
jgi:DNA-binding SARP family transcriptional activator